MPRLSRRHRTAAATLVVVAFFYIGSILIKEHATAPHVEGVDLPVTSHSKTSVSSVRGHHHTKSPPQECDYCGPTDRLCKEYGAHNLARSRAYEGTNARLRRVIAKAQRGEPIIVSVLGGSVTAGHRINHSDNWTTRFFKFWNQTFPHPDNRFINGAVPAVTSDYYMSCALEHIDENSDIILLEMSINDGTQPFFTEAFEWLVRRLLALPNHPAIVNTQVLALKFHTIATGGENQLSVAVYYDIPTISMKNVVASQVMRDSTLERELFGMASRSEVDLRHLGPKGHRILADLLEAYIRRQICKEFQYRSQYNSLEPSGQMSNLLPSSSVLEELPRLRLWSKYNQKEITPDVTGTCMSMSNTKNRLKPFSTSGWFEWSWEDKSYLIARTPGAKVTFEVNIAVMGSVRLSFQKSKSYGFGKVKCWLNDDYARGMVISGYWGIENMNTVQTETIIHNAPRGKHLVHCEIANETDDPKGGHEFRIVALTSA